MAKVNIISYKFKVNFFLSYIKAAGINVANKKEPVWIHGLYMGQ